MHSFLWQNNIIIPQLLYSSVNGHLGCFHVLAIVNRAAMNTGVHVSFSTLFSLVYMPSSGIVGSYGGFTSSFLRNLHTVLQSGYFNFYSHQRCKRIIRSFFLETNILIEKVSEKLYLEQDLAQVDLETKLTSQEWTLSCGRAGQDWYHTVWAGWYGRWLLIKT